eukprot:CAMPEP_0177199122 /NCGR_PEP_ID=MMETSP0367-20130122/25501_1 /TAXON_ID=447022 ORGANISM="Scrippsiella hangoei-like, Strain SHHI-4" /NCGR_SAMPLE_ID=MMETSP0367 /ASSEMBLY_ACC=CAM_ASM_000362 /LENGTH=332 /DNA_ID=CAMNT_0018647441 /DNA_START=25 /DNA_END=1023 /DNA_ORIENTATION=-
MEGELPSGSVVCVTGGSGFLGSWCVKWCLDAGFTVRTTVRSAEKAAYLKDLPGASERLTCFAGVDLLAVGAFDEAIDGCVAVLHTASPFFFEGATEEVLVLPALEGTRNVLASCTKFGVRRVALTSSTASVYANYGGVPDDHVYTGADWSPEDVLRAKSNWYCLSKTLAEREAWRLAEAPECPWTLTVLNPTLIFGPQLSGQPHLNTSSKDIVACMDGSMPEVPNACKTIVDVRDVAEAHVAAVRTGAGAGQRFLLIAGSPHWSEVCDIVRASLGAAGDEAAALAAGVPTAVSSKVGPAVLGYRSVSELVETAVGALLTNGFRSSTQYKPGA